MSDRRVSEVLHEAGRSAWAAAISHPMVRAIGDGTLPHATFHRYFTQNVLYLEAYARAIGTIISKAPDRAAIAVLTRFETQIVATEIPANLAFLERLGGDPDTFAGGGSMLPTTYAYTSHVMSTCAFGDCAEGLTAVLPCQWSYAEIARPLIGQRPADPIYADWIGVFGNDGYDDLVAQTTALLDRLVDVRDGQRMSSLARIFERSTRYEAAFWDMAYGTTRAAGPADQGGAP